METRRVEQLYKGVLCVRYAGQVWARPENETEFKRGERPYVTEGFANQTVIIRRIGGRRKEEWTIFEGRKTYPRFCVQWSDEAKMYVGTCDRDPSLSFPGLNPEQALLGIMRLAQDASVKP